MRNKLTDPFGKELATEKASDLILAIDGMEAVADELLFSGGRLSKKQGAPGCVKMKAGFGPGGTISPGLIDTE